MGIFSLHQNKSMTCGVWGLIITNDENLYYRVFSSHGIGIVRKDGRLSTAESYAISWGQVRRMAGLCGAVALFQMAKLRSILSHMCTFEQCIKEALKNIPILLFVDSIIQKAAAVLL